MGGFTLIYHVFVNILISVYFRSSWIFYQWRGVFFPYMDRTNFDLALDTYNLGGIDQNLDRFFLAVILCDSSMRLHIRT